MRQHLALAVLLLTAACQTEPMRLAGSKHARLGQSSLVTEYRRVTDSDREIALLHVLFLPTKHLPPTRSSGAALALGGTVARYELTFDDSAYGGWSRTVQIVNCTTVEAGGHSFDLERGNVFLSEAGPDGRHVISQVPRVLQAGATPVESVLAEIKAAFPEHAYVQTVRR